jgi:hypothetical protein
MDVSARGRRLRLAKPVVGQGLWRMGCCRSCGEQARRACTRPQLQMDTSTAIIDHQREPTAMIVIMPGLSGQVLVHRLCCATAPLRLRRPSHKTNSETRGQVLLQQPLIRASPLDAAKTWRTSSCWFLASQRREAHFPCYPATSATPLWLRYND